MSDEMEQWLSEILHASDEDEGMTDKQIRIIQAAVEIFAEKGYSATSTSEIAQKAGVAEGTIFRHYKTKKELLLSIVTPMMAKLIAPFVLHDIRKVLDSEYESYEGFLRAMLVNRIQFARQHAARLKIMVHEIPFQPELQALFKEHIASKIVERVQRITVYFQERGQIVGLPPLSLMRMSASVAIGYVAARYFFAPDLAWDEEKEIDMMLHFIMHGLTPVPG